jgi:hypothetical protein
MTTKSHYKRFFKGFFKGKPNITLKVQAVLHYREKSKKLDSNINLVTHNQTLKQLKILNYRNHHVTVNINI